MKSARPLAARWSMLSTPPDQATTPAGLRAWFERESGEGSTAGGRWQPIPGPSTVAAALRALGIWSLDAPPRRFDADDWWFRAVLETPQGAAAGVRRWVFDGLAGLCEVWLEDAPLLTSRNTHRAWTVDAPPQAPAGSTLLLRFAALDRWLEARRPRPRWRAPMVEHPQLRHVRASLVGRTPGWSPPAAPVGPWRGVRVVADRRVEVADLRVVAQVDGSTGRLAAEFALHLDGADAVVERVELELSRDGETWRSTGGAPRRDGSPVAAALANAARPGPGPGPAPDRSARSQHALALEVPDAALWWPHTHGEPALHQARLRVVFAAGEPFEVELGAIGFRIVAVETCDGDFAVSVNGVPIFCRGACWTTLDPVALAATPSATRATLAAARDAGLNMLRVAGVGPYADDAFLDGCDALGLLVWHDFAFASLDYPDGDPAFVDEVRAEALQQLERWQGRASLAIVCGNSEVAQQAAMWGAPRAAWSQPLFEHELAELCARHLPGAFYWPSSAHGGAFPHQTNAGTTSYYGIGAYRRPLEDARRSGLRFATECLAFANVPAEATLARMPGGGAGLRVHQPAWKARSPRDLGAGWDFDDIRDAYLAMLYRVDPLALRGSDHARYLEMSRAVGAEVVAAAFAEWRRPGSSCRGALVWTLRDLWAGAGWGLLDELGVPKAAFHGLRRGAAPVAAFMSDEGTAGLELHLVNDPPRPLAGVVEVALYRDDGLRLDAASRPVEVPPHGGRSLPVAAWFDRFVDLNDAYRFGPAAHALVVATLRDTAGRRLGEAFHFVGGLSNERRRDVGLEVRDVEAIGAEGFAMTVASRGCAQSVAFDAPGFVAVDAYFHLAPGASRRVRLVPAPAGHGEARGRRGSVAALNVWETVAFEIPA